MPMELRSPWSLSSQVGELEPPSGEAFHGVAGEFVRMLDPHTEADPVAILVQTLVGFGSLIGRGPYFPVEADKHHSNLFVALVGATSKGRKGTSLGHVRLRLTRLDAQWNAGCTQSGLSSGEGLIWAVRDPIEQENGKGELEVVDFGIADKRLLVIESEFAATLRVLGRDGNILSAIVRQAWDSGELRILTKNSPAKATGAHISMITHGTRDEVRRYLDRTEAGNGFANRFLWICTKRSKVLPEGGQLDQVDFSAIDRGLATALDFARQLGNAPIPRDNAARDLWREVYPDLSEGRPGLRGAVTSRAEAQVMRLALVYALLECSATITRPHLEAALSLWRYAEASAGVIFEGTLGDPVADTILSRLRQSPSGCTRTEIRDAFGKHKPAAEIERALKLLAEKGLARVQAEATGGRSVERWVAL